VDATDATLIQRSLAGDTSAFDALMSRYQGLVFTVARNCTRDREEALDVCQDAVLKAFRRLGSLREGASFKYWIARIAHNEGINWVRRNRRRAEAVDAEGLERRPAAAPSQEAQLLSAETGSHLAATLGRLNRRYRLAMSLRYVEGLSIAEIAAVLRCSEGVVKSMLFRSVRRLRQELAESRQVS